MVEESVTSVREILEKLKKGEVNRHYAETAMNHSSSRSHTLFRLTVKAVTNEYIRNYRKNMAQGERSVNVNNKELLKSRDGTIVTESYLNFVDLAGSEKISVHGEQIKEVEDEHEKEELQNKAKARVQEGKSINKSLFFLTQVISLKARGQSNTFIPFRNSPLTKILRSSLGGNFRTLVILCVNPSTEQLEHSLSTLRFGMNAKKIKNKVSANIVTQNNMESIQILIENYEKKIRDLESSRVNNTENTEKYITIINELEIQRAGLLERLEEANKKINLKLVSEIP